jgi:hypothetical protein
MFNNNNQFNNSLEWTFLNINKSIIFLKFKNKENKIDNLEEFLITNLNNKDILNEHFESIRICRLKLGEYVNKELNYNNDLIGTQEYIGSTALNAITDYDKYHVIMESLFQDVPSKITF